MIRRVVVALAALMSGTGLPAQTAQTATTTLDAVSGVPEIDKTTQTQDVKFHNERDDRMTVPVRLSGAGPYHFLVDTGADRTAVSRELVARLKLPSAGGAELHTVAGVSTVHTARIADLELTRTPDKLVEAAVLDGANIGADGIVGVDLLRSQRVQFDFQSQTISIVPSASPDFHSEPGTIVVEARRKNGRLIVTDAVANDQPLTIVLDTGSQVSIGNQALRQRLLGRDLINGLQTVELESVAGEKITGDPLAEHVHPRAGHRWNRAEESRGRVHRRPYIQAIGPRQATRPAARNERDPRLQEGLDRFRQPQVPGSSAGA